MENKYRAVKSFIKSSKKLIKEIDKGNFNINYVANIKGNLKLLDEGDYQKFSDLIKISDICERDCKFKTFLIEKITSYKNYDFWPQDERLKEAEYKRERNKLILSMINKFIDILIKLRSFFGR